MSSAEQPRPEELYSSHKKAEQQEAEGFESPNEEAAAEFMEALKKKAEAKGTSVEDLMKNPKLVDEVIGPAAGYTSAERVALLGMMALSNRPVEGYQGSSVQHFRGEMDREKAWRKSINALRSYAVRPTSRYRDEEDRKTRNMLADQAHAALVSLGGRQQRSEAPSTEAITRLMQDMTVKILDWEILPVGEGQPASEKKEGGTGPPRSEPDPARAEFIEHLEAAYGGTRYRSSLRGSTKKYPYFAVVFRQPLPGGDYREIAVAENPLEGNAIYIAEDGDGRSWRDLLSADKETARKLGALKRIHQKDWPGRVEGYLQERLGAPA